MLTTAKPESEDGQVESRQDGDPSGDTDFAEATANSQLAVGAQDR
jgi:hypothetical protein